MVGLIVETRSPGGCLMYPFNHFVTMATPTWPDDAAVVLPKLDFVSVFLSNNELVFTDENGFDSEIIKKISSLASSYNLKNLSFEEFYHVLAMKEEKVCLVGLRSKATHDLENADVIKVEAEKAGLYVL